jgi:small subunit ribosomal protein S3
MNKFSRNAELDEFLEQQLKDAGYGGVDISTSPVGTRITLYVQRPGLVIGRRGIGIRDLTEKLEKKFMLPNPQISVVEEQAPELNPRIMCSRIAQTVVRGTAFRRAAIWALNSMMNAGAMGAEIIISGKLRSERAHFEKYTAGVVPKSGDTAERSVRKATTDVLLKMGLYGVRVKIAIKDAIPPEIELKQGVTPELPTNEKSEESKQAKETSEAKETAGSAIEGFSTSTAEKQSEKIGVTGQPEEKSIQ